MPADRDRLSFDKSQLYRAVVAQQGRVTLAADTNEAQEIQLDENREQVLDLVGRVGTPDNGYALSFPGGADIEAAAGTMYVGGLRAFLPQDIRYSAQPDWLTPDPRTGRTREYVYLRLEEREISAAEDSALREVALGGPDAAQRLRLLQRIVRDDTTASNCADALAAARAAWDNAGWQFDSATMRLQSEARLQVGFATVGVPASPCEPSATGGFLDADNQLIRIRLTAPNRFVWGYDNASFLYRVQVTDASNLKLTPPPPDTFHRPKPGDVVELLPAEALLANGEYIAAGEGTLVTLTGAFSPETQTVPLPSPLPAPLTPPDGTPRLFLRVWKQEVTFTSGTPVALGSTGLEVTITVPNNIHTGDFWAFAARPGVAPEQQIVPARYRLAAQPPEGPRFWICPLGIVNWTGASGAASLLADCRERFEDLVTLTKRRASGGCCTVNLTPAQLAATTLDDIVRALDPRLPARICFAPGEYVLRNPVLLAHPALTLEACPGGVTFTVAAGQNDRSFRAGMFLLGRQAGVTFRGLRFEIPSAPAGERMLLDLERAELDRFRLLNPDEFTIAIGIHTVDAAELRVLDCEFLLPEPSPSHLGAAVAGTGSTGNLEIAGCRFTDVTRGKLPLVLTRSDFMCRTALLYTHSVVGRLANVPGAAAPVVGLEGQVGVARITALQFTGNYCEGLSAAVFVQAVVSEARVDSNTIERGYSGVWLLGPHALTTLERTFIELYKEMGDAIRAPQFLNDHALRLLSSLGRSIERHAAPAQRLPFAPFLPPAQHPFPPTNGIDVLIRLDRHFILLNQAERLAFRSSLSVAGALHFDRNNFDTRAAADLMGDSGTSGPSAVVWGDDLRVEGEREFPPGSTCTFGGNQLQALTTGAPVAVVIIMQAASVTGNTILNFARATELLGGLVCYPHRGSERGTVAIMSNVIQGMLRAPARTSPTPLPTPLNDWRTFNTISVA